MPNNEFKSPIDGSPKDNRDALQRMNDDAIVAEFMQREDEKTDPQFHEPAPHEPQLNGGW